MLIRSSRFVTGGTGRDVRVWKRGCVKTPVSHIDDGSPDQRRECSSRK